MNPGGEAAMSPVILFFIISLVGLNVLSSSPTHIETYCPNTTFFSSTNSALRLKYDNLLSNLSSAANISSTPGFHNSTVGSPAVYGLYMCRGDDDAATCRDCVATASSELAQNCPLASQAVTWYDECMIRYSNSSFFSQMDDSSYGWLMWNTNNVTGNVTHFEEVVSAALNNVTTKAAGETATLKFATESEKFDEFQTVYVLAQCTPDISSSDCYTCLQECINSVPRRNSQGGRVLFFSCNLRYDIYQFYQQILIDFNPIHTYCPDSDLFSPGDAASYTYTIGALLTNLSSAANTSSTPGFYNSTIGNSPTLYGMYLCRGDVPATTCRDCVAAASTYLPNNCTRGKQAVVLYDECMIRYSTQYFFGFLDSNNEPLYNRTTPRNVSGPSSSNWGSLGAAVQKAADKVISDATQQANSTVKMMAIDQENVVTTNYTIYMLAQCTPDLSVEDCGSCLSNSVNTLDTCCLDQQGGAVYYFSCNLRFEMYQFYSYSTPQINSTVAIPTTNSPTGTPSHNTSRTNIPKSHTLLITGLVITGTVVLLLSLALLFQLFQRMKFRSTADTADLNDIMTVEALQMGFNTIRVATQNFSIDNKLGQGGFGSVYKGILENGQMIAVKRLSNNSGQGITEFKTEVIIVAKLQHRNLVRLLGFCVSGKERILVYEFLPNSSLDKFLSDPTKRMSLNWETRFKIICGIAKGLMYLHEDSRLRVIHRDLKSSNILLDEDLNPKISDFGLAKLFGIDQTQAITESIAGTYGYMAPEYILMGHYSIKSDVYSFGIIILEMVSGQRNKYTNNSLLEEALLYRAWKLWNEGEALKLVDDTLNGIYAKDNALKCVHVGLLCIQESVTRRPNMASVVAALGGQSITLPLPSTPNVFSESYTSSSHNTNSLVISRKEVSIAETSDITELQGR